jgi:hypothetical protein
MADQVESNIVSMQYCLSALQSSKADEESLIWFDISVWDVRRYLGT